MAEKVEHETIERAPLPFHDTTYYESPPVKRGHDIDDAFRLAVDGHDVTWTVKEENRLFISEIVSYSDTQAYGFAALFGLVQDLKLYALKVAGDGQVTIDLSKYSFSSSITNLGAVAGQFFYRFSTITQPLAIIITSMWWKTQEQPLRVVLFIAGSALGQLVGQAIDLGATGLTGVYESSPWKWIYVILGSVTIGTGLATFFIFPAAPMTAWFLTPKEKTIAVRRLTTNQTGIQTRKFKLKQLREVATDSQVALLGVYAFAFAFANAAGGSYGPFLITSFGYSNRQGILLLMPATAVAMVSMVASGILGSKFPRHRILIAMLFILPSLAGNCNSLEIRSRQRPYAACRSLYPINQSTTFYGALVQQFSLLAANVAGHTKKSATNATIVLLANLGGFSGPWSYHGSEAQQGYPTGQISTLSLLSASEAAFAILWMYYRYKNKGKAALRAERPELVDDPNLSFVDLTDQENPVFNYVC
ncbi:hypothetical protein M409DRAFT_26805 [Zasmidium cellare ATCC 36951]|uniref:Major facilitator superfamily (MFS) profile domain-containing protein n=1 Tax=Zasmidium cellare ATCC 36951 TaxID=1080233 RepID=A0A6A6C7X5_ZASCE|nr:uncharacterized protein M409DRAFT_26805 [Zasmidium cellare ATCC 36951]KAF2162953.1 hypothetical protein M409DRAFT_26805 [Zasmidium cellare ATCC 36951]